MINQPIVAHVLAESSISLKRAHGIWEFEKSVSVQLVPQHLLGHFQSLSLGMQGT